MKDKKVLMVCEECDDALESAVKATILNMGIEVDKLNLHRPYRRSVDKRGRIPLDSYGFALVIYSHSFEEMSSRQDYKFQHQHAMYFHGFIASRMGEENVGVISRPRADSYSTEKNFSVRVDAESGWQLKLLNKLKSLGFQIDVEKFVALAGRMP